jgi:hypothetical protein
MKHSKTPPLPPSKTIEKEKEKEKKNYTQKKYLLKLMFPTMSTSETEPTKT